jgi:CBS domain-containing protein
MSITVQKVFKGSCLHCVHEHDTVLSAVRVMVEHNIGAVAVVRDGELVGMFSERDLMKRVVAEGRDANKVTVREAMTHEVTAITPEAPVESAMVLMKQGKFRHLPITQGRKVVGMLSLRDLLLHEVEEKDADLDHFRRYVASA